MKFKNTSKFDKELLKEIVRFCKPSKVTKFDIWFKDSRSTFQARAYCDGCAFHGSFSPYIVVRMNKGMRFPIIVGSSQGYLKV